MDIYIFHGAYGSPNENWIPWLKQQLSSKHTVHTPHFPTPHGQTLQNWKTEFGNQDVRNALLIGHSIGATFILSMLEEQETAHAILVSGFTGALNNPAFDNLNSSFMHEFNWTTIQENCRDIVCIHGEHDPYVPMDKALSLAHNLNAPLITIPQGKHLNADAGYTTFPELLQEIHSRTH